MKDKSLIRLTQYSHGAGCGCKLSPIVLDEILSTTKNKSFPGLLVGYEHKDDAAVMDLGDGTAIISTTDFFMPVVDDPFDFGQIASVNAISDVYAMGGRPILAIGILGWPIDKIPSEYAKRILEGANFICAEHKIPLAGGHSIDCPEPVFGLAVTGRIHINHLKVNSGAKPGDCIYLTKGLGIGVLTTAEKKSIISPQHKDLAKSSMVKSNKIGQFISEYSEVHAMTDVTGFGLAGHLLEMCEASELNAKIHYVNLPAIDTCVFEYIKQGAVPGGTHRNWKSYGSKVSLSDESWISFVADPQTSGGLLIAIDPNFKNEFEKLLSGQNQEYFEIGQFVEKKQTPAFRIQIS